jgi:protein TonB
MPVPVTEPRPIAPVRIGYPELARKRGVQGTAVLEVAVDEAGAVTKVLVVQSSGSALLDEAARSAFAAARFEPARRGPAAIPFTFRQPVRFVLHEMAGVTADSPDAPPK